MDANSKRIRGSSGAAVDEELALPPRADDLAGEEEISSSLHRANWTQRQRCWGSDSPIRGSVADGGRALRDHRLGGIDPATAESTGRQGRESEGVGAAAMRKTGNISAFGPLSGTVNNFIFLEEVQ